MISYYNGIILQCDICEKTIQMGTNKSHGISYYIKNAKQHGWNIKKNKKGEYIVKCPEHSNCEIDPMQLKSMENLEISVSNKQSDELSTEEIEELAKGGDNK